MAKYRLLLLDADGTLLDFRKAQENAFFKMKEELNLHADREMLELYDSINRLYWEKLERAEIAKEDLIVLRFQDLFEQFRIAADPKMANDIYTKNLADGTFLIDGALETCEELARHCRLVIATNGQKATQFKRIQQSTLHPYIEKIFVSEEVGAAKPDSRFFSHVLAHCNIFDKSQVLMVGDSLIADVKGALDFGLDACWVNGNKETIPKDLPVTAVIKQVKDLIPVVLR